MHGVGTNLAPMQRRSQGPARKMVFSSPPHSSFLLGLNLSPRKSKSSVSGTNEAPGPWRVDLVVQYYKIYLRKKQPRPPRSSPNVSWFRGQTFTSRCWTGERVTAGHWCQYMMEQHKVFLPCEHVHKHLELPWLAARKLLKVTAGCSVQ